MCGKEVLLYLFADMGGEAEVEFDSFIDGFTEDWRRVDCVGVIFDR